MPDAIVGCTGFVGNNLVRQHHFDELYSSANVGAIAGRHFDLLVCAALPGAKWVANRDPVGDRANVERLVKVLKKTTASQAIIISTVDVYPIAIGVNEDTIITKSSQQPYGNHRYLFELWARRHFPSSLIVRLPGLFGDNLKKNVVYDLLNNNQLDKIHCESRYQFYCLDRLWRDVCRARDAELQLVNFATEPISVRELAHHAFSIEFDNRPEGAPATYDFRSQHAAVFGGRHGYLQESRDVLQEIKAFVARVRDTAQ
jgi:hypothetical protein